MALPFERFVSFLGQIVSERAVGQFGPDPFVAHELRGRGVGEAVADDSDGEVAVCGVEAEHGRIGDSDTFGGVGGGEDVVIVVVVSVSVVSVAGESD